MELILERELDHQKKAVDSMMSALDGISVKKHTLHYQTVCNNAIRLTAIQIYSHFTPPLTCSDIQHAVRIRKACRRAFIRIRVPAPRAPRAS